MTNLNKKLIWTVLFGLVVVIAVTFLADFKNTVTALSKFKIVYLPLILGLTFVNYLLRFVKWQYFLKQISVSLPVKDSFIIFLSGLAMTVTPGKAGELLKSLLLKELKGVAVSRTAPVIFAERLSDGFGLIFLSLSGIALFKYGGEVLLFIVLVLLIMVLVIKTPRLYNPFIGLCSKIPVLKRFTGVLETLIHNAGLLMTFRSMMFAIIISVVSWAFESAAFYYVFIGLGYKVPLLVATFTLAFSSIVGSVSMLPGGLGAAEGSIIGLLIEVAGVPKGIAAVATIIIRFCTLWFGVAVGLLAIVSSRRLVSYVNQMGTAGDKEEV
ncbi:MAG: flippase-like domain-containing protein [Firmicutes bacterium]|nr:flippase-like domain-containing protein [Bacillota bacterium]